MRLYVGPFGIGEVGLVCSSHARYPTELLSQDPFSDSFRRGILGNSEAQKRAGAVRDPSLFPELPLAFYKIGL